MVLDRCFQNINIPDYSAESVTLYPLKTIVNIMNKINFIGIGVQKGGTSWLHRQLLNHPQVFVPKDRKEIHFFDEYYDRGLSWYEKWFTGAQENHIAIGEITPNYIYDEKTAPRIKTDYTDMHFIVILRDPVARAYSQYQMMFQSGIAQKYKGFDDFMTHHPHAFKRGLYARQLAHWFEYFPMKNFLILKSEDIFDTENGIENTFKKISDFLKINPDLFNITVAQEKIGGAREAPASSFLAKLAQKTRLFLRNHDMDAVAAFLKKIGLTRNVLGSKKTVIAPLSHEDKTKWAGFYQKDQEALKKLLADHA